MLTLVYAVISVWFVWGMTHDTITKNTRTFWE